MRHGFGMTGMLQLWWVVILVARFVPDEFARWKAARRERLAVDWPVMPGRVRDGSTKLILGRRRLTLTYSYDEGGYGIELWEHDFATIGEAEHAKRVLNNRPCIVHYNPERVGVTTLLWSEVKAELEREPYVPKPVQLVRWGRVGYRWGIGAAVLAWCGLAASAAVYGMAMGGSPWCVCEAMLVLLAMSPVVLIASMVSVSRVLMLAPRPDFPRRVWWAMNGWERGAMGVTLVGMVMSLVYFGPMMRALPMDAEIPDRVMAGALGVLAVPLYLFSAMMTLTAVRRLRPVEEAVGVTTSA